MRSIPLKAPRPRRRAGLGLGLALLLALLIGCGGESGETGAGQPDSAEGTGAAVEGGEGGEESVGAPRLNQKPISKRVFRRRANRICEGTVGAVLGEAGPLLKEAREESEAARKAAEVELLETVMGPGLRREVEQIGALGTPPGDRAPIERFLAAVLDSADRAESDPESIVRSNQASLLGHPTRLADAYGLEACPYG